MNTINEKERTESIFDEFTNKYALSKTLRFELKPVGDTLKNMKEAFRYDEKMQTFLADQDIEDAYQALKPTIDKIHENFITESLESKEAKSIDFSDYLKAYKEKKDDKGEKKLREEIGKLYKIGEKKVREEYKTGWKWDKKKSLIDKKHQTEWKVGGKTKEGAEIMKSSDILCVAAANADDMDEVLIEKHLRALDGFFTYFSGFNKNRQNYYATKDEKATAIATRIIHENLPKFCDNIISFQNRRDTYIGMYEFLKSKNINVVDRDQRLLPPLSENIFDIAYFSHCLSQKEIEDYNAQIGDANFLINLYNQQQKKKGRLLEFKILYKQIGCGKRDSLFFALKYDREADIQEEDRKKMGENEILSVEKVLEIVEKAGKKYFSGENEDETVNTVPKFIDWLKKNAGDWSGIYWSGKAVNTISSKYFENWDTIIERIGSNPKEYENVATYDKKREQQVKLRDAVELKGLFELLNASVETQKETWWKDFFRKNIWEDEEKLTIIKKEHSPSKALMALVCTDILEHAKNFNDGSDAILQLEEYKTDEGKKQIKTWMDEGLAVSQMLKYFLVRENKTKGETLNSDLVNILNGIIKGEEGEVDWFKWYDALRNYLTKKPQDDAKENKLKLNFLNSTLAGGWDVNKESDNACIIVRDPEGRKYLAVMRKNCNKLFEKEWIEGRGKNKQIIKNPLFDKNGEWTKMEYKQIAAPTGIGGFVRKCFQTAQKYGWKCPVDCLNDQGKIITKNEEAKKSLVKIIDCYKDFFEKYEKDGFKYREFNFQFKPSADYSVLSEFFTDVENQGYKISFISISKIGLDKLVREGKIYLFEIRNQDNNDGKSDGHKQNLHTMYWNSVFSKNTERPKLNGGAELFYRKQAIKEKKVKKGYESKPWVIEGKRFTENAGLEGLREANAFDGKSFFFHCSIKLNYKSKYYEKPEYAIGEINAGVNNTFSSQDVYFLGLDRGEKHLVYYSLIDQKGNIKKQGSFNEINGHNYLNKLIEREGDRDEARKNWQLIENIKELKAGYISQVVYEIAKIVQENPTYIVLEDLSTGFKRGRQKIERQVYQKFELALAKKMNFLVNKTAKEGEIGSVANALQLTPPVQNYGDIENRKQVGIMLYTRANYTSQTDPLTGWRKTIYLKSGPNETTYAKNGNVRNKSVKDQIGEQFDEIGFENGHYFFEYTEKNIKKTWRLWSGHDGTQLLRYRGKRGNKNEWTTEEVSLEEKLNALFAEFGKREGGYLDDLMSGEKELNKIDDKHAAWESLRYLIEIIQQIRNSGDTSKGQDDNFILSPVRNENGEYFDSRDYEKQEDPNLPKDADANGAYNIARKGIIMNAHIQKWIENGRSKNDKNTSDLNLFIFDEEWDLWLNNCVEWEKRLHVFSSKKAMEEERGREKKKK